MFFCSQHFLINHHWSTCLSSYNTPFPVHVFLRSWASICSEASTYKSQHGRVTCHLSAIAFLQLCTLIAVRLSDSLKCGFGHITLYSFFAFCFLLFHLWLFSTIYCLFYSRLCLIFSLITLLS